MKPTILVCGSNGTNRQKLIEAVAPQGTIPNEEECSQSVIYETDVANYVNCTIIPKADRYYGEDLEEELKVDFSFMWYCIELNLSDGDINFLKDLPYFSAVTVALITDNNTSPDELEKFYDKLDELGVNKKRVLVVSFENKATIRRLLTTTLEILGKKVIVPVKTSTVDTEADSLILWAAGRAFCIAAVPLPMADVAPLVANEAYMFYKLGELYGYSVNQTMLSSFLGCIGASVGGKLFSSFRPFLKAPIAAGITYAVGVVANEYFSSDMQLSKEDMKTIFEKAKKKAKSMKWN